MEKRKFTAAIYARTDEADGQRSWDEIDRQHNACHASAARLGIDVVANVDDLGQPGDKTNRPGIAQLLAHAAHRPFDYAMVSSIDRLADRAEQLNYLLLRLKNLGATVLMADHDTAIELVLPSDMEVLHGADDDRS